MFREVIDEVFVVFGMDLFIVDESLLKEMTELLVTSEEFSFGLF